MNQPAGATSLTFMDLAARISGLAGWRRNATAFLLGAFAVAAQPPVSALPVLIVSFTGLVWLLDGAGRPRRAFIDGWMFGAGYFAAGLYWISNALLVDADRFGWLIPIALGGLSLGLGLFNGCAALLARRFWSDRRSRVLLLAVSWTFFEWLRGVVLTGFPWNPIGNVWVAVPQVLQTASWAGVYGLSALTVLAAACFACVAQPSPGRWRAAFSGTAVLAICAVAGFARLSDASDAGVDGIQLRVVQPNISQQDKWRPEKRAENYALHLELSRRRGDGKVTHVIWPETAAPFGVTTDTARRALMRAAVPPGGLLITGAPRFRFENGRLAQIWNSLVAVDETGSVAAVYDKHHLVPFGEYMPFRDILPLDKITAGALDFSRGPGLATIRAPGLPPFSPLICYEVIFPSAVVRGDDRPDWILNLTNDGWFGISAGPHQHFASARLRAVEEGLPVVRAANTGISAVIDPYGRVVSQLALGTRGVLDSHLPLPAAGLTMYSRFGNFAPGFLLVIMLALYFLRRNSWLQKKETI